MSKKIRKAVIPAAGYGTRFLPATKAQPKEMLPIVDKPIIQYVVEDAISAGIEDIIIVTGWTKRSIEDHFDYPFELEKRLLESGKLAELEEIRKISNMANFHYIRQKGPLGNATPILNAKNFIGDEPFVVMWGDEFIDASPTRCQQLCAAYEQFGGDALLASIKKDAPSDYKKYGYAAGPKVFTDSGLDLTKIQKIIEKPGPENKVSDMAVVSAMVFSPSIFEAIEEASKRHSESESKKELTYIDGINVLLEQDKNCYALGIKDGRYHDCGNKLEYLKTVVEFGLKHKEVGEEFKEFLKNLE